VGKEGMQLVGKYPLCTISIGKTGLGQTISRKYRCQEKGKMCTEERVGKSGVMFAKFLPCGNGTNPIRREGTSTREVEKRGDWLKR